MQIKTLSVKADLDVIGIVNMNGRSTTAKQKNHLFAKRDQRGFDFTSSRLIRQRIFSDLMPRQPATRDLYDNAVPVAASMIGILRGFMFPERGCKRASPLCVLDAYTKIEYTRQKKTSDGLDSKLATPGKGIDTGVYRATFSDVGRSSKPQESNLKNKKGEKVSDTSFWSKDNAGRRLQEFEAKIDFSTLSFLSLNYGDDSVVSREDEGAYVQLMNEMFASLGEEGRVSPDRFVHKTSLVKIPQHGILLNDTQIHKVLGYLFDRIQRIEIQKAGSSLRLLPETIEIIASDGNQSKRMDFGTFIATLDTLSFYKAFYTQKEYEKLQVLKPFKGD